MRKSRTIKIKPHTIDAALYITIVNNDEGMPYKILVNCKNSPTFEWIQATRITLNALLKQQVFPVDVLNALCEIPDANGGYYYKGKQIPSIPAHIAIILRNLCIEKGLMVGVSG